MAVRRARVLWVLFAIPAMTLGDSACAKPPQVTFNVQVPDAVAATATWIELGVFPGSCPSSKELDGGIPPEGAISRVAFRKSDKNPPGIGDLKKGAYAFAAVARGDDCAVLAHGCGVVDVTDARDVEIKLAATPSPSGACSAGSTCSFGLCVPGNDNGDPTVGQGCSLQFLGAGPLGDSLAFGGTELSAPAIAATTQGFVIAYREFNPLLGTARLTLIPLDNGGGALTPQQTTLPGTCSLDESDATGMAFLGDKGTVALARAPCGGNGGIDLFAVDVAGAVQRSGFNATSNAKLTLANAHALAKAPGRAAHLLAFSEAGQALLTDVTDVAVGAQAATPFGGTPPLLSGWVATSDQVVGLLALATGSAPTPVDAGGVADGSAGAGGDASTPPAIDAGTGATTELRLQLAAPNASLAMLPAPLTFPGTWGSLAAAGGRVFVASDGASGGGTVSVRAYDLGGATPAFSETFAGQGLGKVLYADVAIAHDRAFLAAEQPGSISLLAYDHATTTPTLLRQVFLPADPRVPSMATVRDGRVAVAASDTRVAVVWTTARSMSANDVTGGYAVFACTTP